MIILASQSPRRRELLAGLGVDFKVLAANADESCNINDPVLYAEELAKRKGLATYRLIAENEGEDVAKESIIISADTVVAAGGEILGKPTDQEDAFRMISLISGDTHSVITGIGITAGGITHLSHSLTRVTVDHIPEDEIRKYISGGDPMDKAGAYGIQGEFSRWVRGIDGCYFGVVGLPLNRLNSLYFEVTGRYLGK